MKRIQNWIVALWLLATPNMAAGAQDSSPISADPVQIDPDHPPAMAELSFNSKGAKLNGHIYVANGAGPHPTIVLLHGFPGNEKNLDLAQVARRAGFNVLFFHYRGAWGSEGDFSFGNVVEDVASAVTFLRGTETSKQYRVNPDKISLIGHSMGGFAALMAGAADTGITCTVALAPANLGNRASGSMSEEALNGFAAYTDSLGMLKHRGGKAVIDEMMARLDEFDTRNLAPKFSERPVLLIAGEQDAVLPPEVYHTPLVAAYEAQADIDLTHRLMQGDHSFSWTRIELGSTVVSWMDTSCR